MVARTLEVIAKVRDAASAKLKKVQKELRNTGKAAKRTGVDFTEFNRIMFSTTAFIGLFTNAMRSVGDAMMQGAQVDRVSNQFERVMGPKGAFFKTISGLTDNTIDRMEAMRSGIALKSLDIAKNMGEVASIVAKAGTAGKLAGIDSAEGIKKYTNFLKTGSIASLGFLNIISETNPELQAQLAILSQTGGPMGKVISMQQKLAIGSALMDAATKDSIKGSKDLLGILQDTGQAFFFLKASVGNFLGTAFGPLIQKVTSAVFSLTDLFERIRTGDKHFMKFTKNLLITGGVITSVLASLGTFRLLLKALGALGLGGIPLIALSVVSLASAFSDLDSGLDRIARTFKLLGSMVLGTSQLMAFFLNNIDPAVSGIGRMDTAIHDLLDEAGLLGLVTNLARAGIVAVEFGKGVVEGIKAASGIIYETFKPAVDLIKDFLGIDSEPWSKNIIVAMKEAGFWIGVVGTGIAGIWGALKLLGGARSILSKIPVIGKLFGGSMGGPGGPSGSASDPIYTISPGSIASTLGTKGKFGRLGIILSNFVKALPLARLGLLGVAAAAGIVIGNLLKGTFVDKGIGKVTDYVAGLLGIEGTSAHQERIDALGGSAGSKVLSMAHKATGTAFDPKQASEMSKIINSSAFKFGSPADTKTLRDVLFNKKLSDPSQLGITGKTITSIPTMPFAESFKQRQVEETMKLLEQDNASRMAAAFKKALEDQATPKVITREEWKDIYREGMDQSKLGQVEERPEHSVAKIKGGC